MCGMGLGGFSCLQVRKNPTVGCEQAHLGCVRGIVNSSSQGSTLVSLSLVSVSHSQPHVLKRHSKGCPETNGEDGKDGAALMDSSAVVAFLFSTGKEVSGDSEAQSCVSRIQEETGAAVRVEHILGVVVSL